MADLYRLKTVNLAILPKVSETNFFFMALSLFPTVPSDARLPRYTGDTWTSSNQPNISGDDDVDSAKKRTLLIYAFSILAATVALLLVILLPLTFSYVEYYQVSRFAP